MKQKVYKYSVCRNNMETNQRLSMAWLIGFFVAGFPIHFAFDGSLIQGLLQGIFGVAIALFILIGGFGKK